ncbi:SEC-C metal-binding domain-containing protein [Zoogloea sp.]|uniref:SEC-C metal-binding domain-containing protein n=1 Tax=Zoogloea sp. TaxID=49181 RepID=UPI0025D4D857|nr:SEC-C metal-binding domain-containing protein [Zoogloea sp.]HOY00415.1 SEC-C metal-binding domain-containing protein [Zoogloea sp.]HPI58928.1 SEC-C metal-binding domain-containing protein [Zoogloea sp.]
MHTVEICICRFWWPNLHATYELQRATTIKRELPKFGRNDPCPCGSGKKFRKCCGVAATHD